MVTAVVDRSSAVSELTRWLESLGLPVRAATVVVDHVVSAELVGRRTHGFRLLPALARGVSTSSGTPDDVAVEETEPGTLLVDGGGLPGIYAVHRAADECRRGHDRGRRVMSAGVVGFTGTTGCLGLFAHRLAEAGLTGLVLATSPPIMAPPGGVQPLLGTNAIAFGAPTRTGSPVVGDFASSEWTYGDVALARDEDDVVPMGVMRDATGQPTTDPAAIVDGTLVPSGGHKGWCQALLVELLAGALVGGKVGFGSGGESALVLSFTADSFAAVDPTGAATELVEQIHSLDVAPDGPPPRAPGGRFEQLRRRGATLDVGLATLRRIEDMGGPTLR